MEQEGVLADEPCGRREQDKYRALEGQWGSSVLWEVFGKVGGKLEQFKKRNDVTRFAFPQG